ncbi:MAG: HEAT repeat domain-containing protein [Planctomycetes bacterium]|nr:HEAT repeat domain-containing protein [Planctomycetota bacterium]
MNDINYMYRIRCIKMSAVPKICFLMIMAGSNFIMLKVGMDSDIRELKDKLQHKDPIIRQRAMTNAIELWHDEKWVRSIDQEVFDMNLNNNDVHIITSLQSILKRINELRAESLWSRLQELLEDSDFDQILATKSVNNIISYVDVNSVMEKFCEWVRKERESEIVDPYKEMWLTRIVYSILASSDQKIKFLDLFSYGQNVEFDPQSIIELFTDESSDVRVRVIEAIRCSCDLARNPYMKDEYVTERDLAKHAQLRCNRFKEDIIKSLGDQNVVVRAAAVQALISFENDDEYVKSLAAKLLKDKSSNVREKAVYVLRELTASNYCNEILKLLDDENYDVQKQVILTLRDLKCEEAGNKLVDIAKKSKDRRLKLAAIETLGYLKLSEFSYVVREFLDHPDDDTKCYAVAAIKRMKAMEYKEDIVKLLSSDNKRLKANVISCLMELNAKECIKDLAKILDVENNENALLIESVLLFLGRFEAIEYAEIVLLYLKHQNVGIRIVAVESLRNMKAHKYINELEKLLNDRSELRIVDFSTGKEKRVTTPREEVLKTFDLWGINTSKYREEDSFIH